NERANRLAHHLRALGVGRGALIGLSVQRALSMVIGILAIVKAGGAYVPRERIAFMIDDARLSVVVTQDEIVARLPEGAFQLLCLGADQERIASASNE